MGNRYKSPQGLGRLSGPGITHTQTAAAGRQRSANCTTGTREIELSGIDEKRSKPSEKRSSNIPPFIIPPARILSSALSRMTVIFLRIYRAKVRSENPTSLLSMLLTKSFHCNMQIIINYTSFIRAACCNVNASSR